MQFRYTAKNKQGEVQSGIVKGANKAAVLNTLSENDLFVVSLDPIKEDSLQETLKKYSFLNRVKKKDVMILTRQLSTLLGAKIPLADALRTLHQQTINERLKDAIVEISSDVDTGFSLSQAISKHPNVFSEFYVNMIRSAEVTGRMEEVMNYLADYLENEAALANKVRNAMIYPVFLIVLFGGVIFFIVTKILPELRPIFEESGIELPFFTRMLMNSGDFMSRWWWAFLLVVAFLVVGIGDYLRTREGKQLFDEIRLKIPLVGYLYSQLYVARFAESTSVLIKGGVPVAQAIEVTARTIDNILYEDALMEAAEAIRRGELISTALSRYPDYFPPFTYQMVAVGETTGRLEELLARVSQFYTREVDSLVENLIELIQPILILFMGLAVGVLFASIIIPIFRLAQAF